MRNTNKSKMEGLEEKERIKIDKNLFWKIIENYGMKLQRGIK